MSIKPSADDQIKILKKIQLIFEKGGFSASYKFALLHAINDLVLELNIENDDEVALSTKKIAERMLHLYWQQAKPFPLTKDDPMILSQSTGKQAAMINWITEAHDINPNMIALKKYNKSRNWLKLLSDSNSKLKEMPLWKLQVIGSEQIQFLYHPSKDPDEIILKSGIAYTMRNFNGMIRETIRTHWIKFIRQQNAKELGANIDLYSFLFEYKRNTLDKYNRLLVDLQKGNCFYCKKSLKDNKGQIDHFIPWSKYPIDLGHNFVLAHGSCNNNKSDMLASQPHIENWISFHQDNEKDLNSYFEAEDLMHDQNASYNVAKWAYNQVNTVQPLFWLEKDKYDTNPIKIESIIPN